MGDDRLLRPGSSVRELALDVHGEHDVGNLLQEGVLTWRLHLDYF